MELAKRNKIESCDLHMVCEVLWRNLDYALGGDYLDVDDEDDLVIDYVHTNFCIHASKDNIRREEVGTDMGIDESDGDDCDMFVADVVVMVVVGSMSVDHDDEEDCCYGYCYCCYYLQDYHCDLVDLKEEGCTKKMRMLIHVYQGVSKSLFIFHLFLTKTNIIDSLALNSINNHCLKQ